jgi:transcription elongation factor Elf1
MLFRILEVLMSKMRTKAQSGKKTTGYKRVAFNCPKCNKPHYYVCTKRGCDVHDLSSGKRASFSCQCAGMSIAPSS